MTGQPAARRVEKNEALGPVLARKVGLVTL